MSTVVRSPVEADWEALRTVRLASLLDAPTAFGVTHAATAQFTEAQWRERAAGKGQARFELAFNGADPVGIAAGVVDARGQYNLIAMWVHPDFRGQDIAARLVDAVKARALASGHRRIVLTVAPDNARAARFYANQGFAFIDEWEALDSHPHIQLQAMQWLAPSP